jgi:hypothetical protein
MEEEETTHTHIIKHTEEEEEGKIMVTMTSMSLRRTRMGKR